MTVRLSDGLVVVEIRVWSKQPYISRSLAETWRRAAVLVEKEFVRAPRREGAAS